MTETVYPDVSEFQVPVNDSYTRPFLMFRASNEYARVDYKLAQNLTWAILARASGKLANFGVYVIPAVTTNANILASLAGVPTDCVVMIDMEHWNGLVNGDHSSTINDLAEALKTRQGGRADLVWGYGNKGDLAGIWPNRPAWLGFIVAGYGSSSMSAPGVNMIGWQYTNGVENATGYAMSSAPFGNCDHNVLYIPIPTAAAVAQKEDDDVPTIYESLETYGTEIVKSSQWQYTGETMVQIDGDESAVLIATYGVHKVLGAQIQFLRNVASRAQTQKAGGYQIPGVQNAIVTVAAGVAAVPAQTAALVPAASDDATYAAAKRGATDAQSTLTLVSKAV